ncbi:MAG: hypothetical protein ACYTHM_02140 [Planctomycetota bacterium]
MKRRTVFLLCFAFFASFQLVACGGAEKPDGGGSTGKEDGKRREEAAESEPKKAPGDFDFILKYGVEARNEIDSFEGTVVKDLVVGTAETKLKLDEEEMARIFEKIQAVDIFSYPRQFKPPYKDNPDPDKGVEVEPHEEYYFMVRFQGKEKEIVWKDINQSKSKKAVRLREVFKYIDEIIRSKEAYKKLPGLKGSYQ